MGNPVCGDLMEMYVRVQDDRIDDIKFQTFGCGSAVATSSMITELVMGKTLDEALEVTRADVADALDGLPPDQDALLQPGGRRPARRHQELALRHAARSRSSAEEIASTGVGCGAREVTVIEGVDDYAGKGVYTAVDDVAELADKRVLVLDKGVRIRAARPRAHRRSRRGSSS